MNKIPTIFVRDMSRQPALVIDEWMPGTEWVRDGKGFATRKYDGTSCMVRDGKLYKRRELRQEDIAPPDFESLGTDGNTGKTVGWVPVTEGPEDRWHREAFDTSYPDGTYELLGPKVQGNKEQRMMHVLKNHREACVYPLAPRDFEGIKTFLTEKVIEGLVWHHPDGRMAKIKRRDFGLKW
jgi:uncharacterized protein DUF5565